MKKQKGSLLNKIQRKELVVKLYRNKYNKKVNIIEVKTNTRHSIQHYSIATDYNFAVL